MALIVVAGILGPVTNNRAEAGTVSTTYEPVQPSQTVDTHKTPEGCGIWAFLSDSGNTSECLLFLTSEILYYIAWVPSAWFMGLMGKALDFSIEYTVKGDIIRTLLNNPDSAINVGWRIGRDIVNLLLIFVLLFIAISMILQLSRYGNKEILATLIIIAFLVNFSLVITKLIIDAANVFAVEFFNAFPKGADGKTNLSDAFRAGIDVAGLVEKPVKTNLPASDMYLKLILVYGFGAVIAGIAGFIFAVAAVLLLLRMVVLIILMIFSSFAFGAHVLPSTKKHASDWWSQLFNQAFFAPAMFFMLYIAARMIAPDASGNNFIKNALQQATGQTATFNSAFEAIGDTNPTGPVNWGTAAFIMNFIIIIIMLLASIVVAKKMSAFGAESVIAGGKKAISKAQGYAGKYTKRGAGYVSEKVMQRAEASRESGGRWFAPSRLIAGVPGAGRGLARASSWREQQLKERKDRLEKKYAGYSAAGISTLSATAGRNILLPSEKAVIGKLEEKKKQEAFEKDEATKKRHEKEYSKYSEKDLKDVVASPIATELQKEAAREVLTRREERDYKTSSLQLMRELIEAQKTKPPVVVIPPTPPPTPPLPPQNPKPLNPKDFGGQV